MTQSAGIADTPSASFTRPADTTAYASGDLVADTTVAASVVAPATKAAREGNKGGIIPRVRLVKSSVGITNAAFRLHAFAEAPTPANGDNAAFSCNKAAKYLGAYDVTSMMAFTDGAVGIGLPVNGTAVVFGRTAVDMKIYWLVEAKGAYTPVSAETITIIPEVLQD